MTLRHKLADWISGGELSRLKQSEQSHECGWLDISAAFASADATPKLIKLELVKKYLKDIQA